MTEPISISERISTSSETEASEETPRKPSTTISTIVVQSCETRVVIALLKSGDSLQFRILEMNPKLTALGSDVHESEQMLNDHETVISKLEKKQTPVEDLLRQVDALVSNENKDPEVYAAMADCLGEAWSDLNSKLGIRKEILMLCFNFHGHRQICLEDFRKCDNSTRKETLRTYMKAVDTGSELIDKLRPLDDSWESILRVNYWLDDLRAAMLEWKNELQRQENKTKEAKAYQEYLEELQSIKNKKEEQSAVRTELLSMFTRIDEEYRLTPLTKKDLEEKVYEILKKITDQIEILENVKLFLEENNKLDAPNFTEDYSEKLELIKGLDEDALKEKFKKRLDIRADYENILDEVTKKDTIDEEGIQSKLSQDETLDWKPAFEKIKKKFHRHQLGVYELFKERTDIVEASIKEGGELQDYLLLRDIVEEIETDVKNAQDFNRKDEIVQKCKNLAAIIEHRISILEDVKKFINENKDLSDDSFRSEHVKTLRRLTDSKDGRILSCILRNRLTVRNVYELILKSPLDYEEEEIVDLISVDQTLDTEQAVEKIMARRRLLELLKTLDFPLPENLEIAKSDLVDFESFENMVANLPNPPEELIQKTNAKKDKILKCITFYELLDEQSDQPDRLALLAALETELFGTTHWRDLIPTQTEPTPESKVDKVEEFFTQAHDPKITEERLMRKRDSDSSSTHSLITSKDILAANEIILVGFQNVIDDDMVSASPSLNLSEMEFFLPAESEAEDRFDTPNSPAVSRPESKGDKLSDEPSKLQKPVQNGEVKKNPTEPIIAEIRIVTKEESAGPNDSKKPLGTVEIETVAHSKRLSDPDPTTAEILKPIHPTHHEVEVIQITETPVELQNIGMESQIVQEAPELQNVDNIEVVKLNGNPDTQITQVPVELKNIGKETHIVEEPQEVETFITSSLIEMPESDDEILSDAKSYPAKSMSQDSFISEGLSEIEAVIVEEPMELTNIGKQTIIIEESVEFSEMEDDSRKSNVSRVSSEEPSKLTEAKSVSSVKTITQTKAPYQLESEKVEALLAELEELRNANRAEGEKPVEENVEMRQEPHKVDKDKRKSISEALEDLATVLGEDETPDAKKVIENIAELASVKGDGQKQETPKQSISPEKTELKKPVQYANPNSRESSIESVIIPVEVVTSDKSSPVELTKPKFNELTQFEIKSLEIVPKPEKIEQLESNNGEKPKYLEDVIKVETETVHYETELKFTVEKTPPKEPTNLETQSERIPTSTPKRTSSVESQTLDEPNFKKPDSVITEKTFADFGTEPETPMMKRNSIETQTSPLVGLENPKRMSREIEIQTDSPAVSPAIGPPENEQKVQPQKSPKPVIPEKPVGLSGIPRKSAFVETQSIASQSSPTEYSTMQSIYDNPEHPTSDSEAELVKYCQNSEYYVPPPPPMPSKSTDSQGPPSQEFATGMANNLLSEIKRQFQQAAKEKERGNCISTQTSGDFEIDHPEGLLQIITAENEQSRTWAHPAPFSPENQQQHLEGFKSPVQEMETQTSGPPPVLNSETQTVQTLKRLDSSSTQTIRDEKKSFNIQTQTEPQGTQSGTSSQEPGVNIKTQVNYFIPNLFHEIIGRDSASPPEEPQYEEIVDQSYAGTLDKIRIFENISRNPHTNPSHSITTEKIIPISLSPSLTQNTIPVTQPSVQSIPVEKNVPISRIIEIKIPPPPPFPTYSQFKSPLGSPYSTFTYESSTPDPMSPGLDRTPTPSKSRVIEIHVGNPRAPQKEFMQSPVSPKSREVYINVNKNPNPTRMPQTAPAESSNLYPWRSGGSAPAPAAPVEIPERNPSPGTQARNEAMVYTFGHFEDTMETTQTPQLKLKQPSVKDRVKYWKTRTLSETGPETTFSPEMESKTETENKPSATSASGDSVSPAKEQERTSGVTQFRTLYQTPSDYLTEEAVTNSIEERRKELAEYQQKGTVSEYRKLFQSYEQTTVSSNETRDSKSFGTETFRKIPIQYQQPQSEPEFYKEVAKPSEPVASRKSKEPILIRRHSDTISTTTSTYQPNPEESPREGTVAKFKRLFQAFETSSPRQESSIQRHIGRISDFPRNVAGRNDLVTSPPGFRTFDRYTSPADPQREFVQEETQTHCVNSKGEWMTENKVVRSYGRSESVGSPLSPSLRPTKFVPGEFHESDYESDNEFKIPPIWIPPSSSRSPPSVEFRSITPIVHQYTAEYKSTSSPVGFIPVREVPIKTGTPSSSQTFKPEPRQHVKSHETQFLNKPVGPKPVPPPKPTSHSIKETSLMSKITKTEETKYTLRPLMSPQPIVSDEDLSVRKYVHSPDSPASKLPWNQNQPKTTTRIYKTEEMFEKETK